MKQRVNQTEKEYFNLSKAKQGLQACTKASVSEMVSFEGNAQPGAGNPREGPQDPGVAASGCPARWAQGSQASVRWALTL